MIRNKRGLRVPFMQEKFSFMANICTGKEDRGMEYALRCQEGYRLMLKALGDKARFHLRRTLDYALVDLREAPPEYWPAIATCICEALLWYCYTGEEVEAIDLEIFIENALDIGLQNADQLFWVYQVFLSLVAILLKFRQYDAAGKLISATYYGRTQNSVEKIECGTLSIWPDRDREDIAESFKAILPERLTMQDLEEADAHIATVSEFFKKDMWVTWLTKGDHYRLLAQAETNTDKIKDAFGFDPRNILRRKRA